MSTPKCQPANRPGMPESRRISGIMVITSINMSGDKKYPVNHKVYKGEDPIRSLPAGIMNPIYVLHNEHIPVSG